MGCSLVAIACAQSSFLPYTFTTLVLAAAVPGCAYWVVPNSPSSQGLQTSTDQSSFAFWSTRPLPEVNE